MSPRKLLAPGPFTADQLRSGDPYELSNGHPVLCLPTGRRGSTRNLTGATAIETDPNVKSAGIDLGVSTAPGTMRAPDIVVDDIADERGWHPKAPPLAIEYADVGQDEEELQTKISELLEAGTRLIWVVRLTGPRRVEVYEPGKKMRLVTGDDELDAQGVLKHKVPLAVLYDRDAAHEATLRNLLERKGYQSLDAVRDEGRNEGRNEGRSEGLDEGERRALRTSIFEVLRARGLDPSEVESRVNDERALPTLRQWLRAAAIAHAPHELFGE